MKVTPRKVQRTLSIGVALSLFVWGCGPPEMVPVVLPGSKRIVVIPEHEQGVALGEQMQRGAIQPPTTNAADPSIPLAEPTKVGESLTTADNIKYETIRQGTGTQAKTGSLVRVHYDGSLTNGAQFDSSRGRGEPYTFRIGVNEPGTPIRGWHLGISGMRVGEMRRLTIPPELAYGDQGQPPQIPPKATLVFELELMSAE